MSNRDLLAIIVSTVICSNILMCTDLEWCIKTHTEYNKECCQHSKAEIKAYRQYKDATEALLDDIDKDVSLEDTYLCGDIGSDYHKALLQLDSINSVK